MFKIYEDDKLIYETTSGVLCGIYQAFRDNLCTIEDSLNKAQVTHDIWMKLDYSVDTNKLVDYICCNNIDLSKISYNNLIDNFNETALI